MLIVEASIAKEKRKFAWSSTTCILNDCVYDFSFLLSFFHETIILYNERLRANSLDRLVCKEVKLMPLSVAIFAFYSLIYNLSLRPDSFHNDRSLTHSPLPLKQRNFHCIVGFICLFTGRSEVYVPCSFLWSGPIFFTT